MSIQTPIKVLTIVFFISLMVTIFGCKGNEKKFIPDVSNTKLDIEIKRFEQDLFALDTLNMEEAIQGFNEKYEFADIKLAKDVM